MIKIAQDQLPQNLLSYIAFRIAFLDTFERISWSLQFSQETDERFGFLTEVPFLRAVPPHVQLDLLASTWCKHVGLEEHPATLVDESVVYAACELSARVVEEDPATVQRFLQSGPLAADLTIDLQLAEELRRLHLQLANEGDFLLIGQFADLPPDEAAVLKEKFHFDSERAEVMFDVLGRWQIAANFSDRSTHLLTATEIERSLEVMQIKMSSQWMKPSE